MLQCFKEICYAIQRVFFVEASTVKEIDISLMR